jgi:xylose dehydrogenase (NAD/NADP)
VNTNWGFIGAGNIAKVALGPAVHNAKNATLYAVASRDPIRSAALNPVKVHDSYQDLIDDPDVDAVYISLANDQHITWSIKAMLAGKDVLCEKPLALNAVQVQEMIDVAETNNRLLVEAVWARFHPRLIRTVQLINDGAIGQLTAIDSSFAFESKLQGNYRLDPAMGGGSLLDVGLYQLHLWLALSQDLGGLQIQKLSRNISESGVDLTTRFSAQFANGVKVDALSSFELPAQQHVVVTGTAGSIEFIDGQAFTTWKEVSSLRVNGVIEEFAKVDAYQLMVEAFSAKIQGGTDWVVPLAESLACAKALDQISQFVSG